MNKCHLPKVKNTNLLQELSIETIKKMTGDPTEEYLMYEINVIAQVLEG